jgi:hypothetical protein
MTVFCFFCFKRYTIIPLLADVLNASEKEKVKRVILALFRVNLKKNKIVVEGTLQKKT